MVDHQPRPGFIADGEKIQFPPQFAVVAPFGLFQQMEVLLQGFFRGKGRAINALEHLVAFVPPPVGAGQTRQLESRDPPGGREMRPPAKVDEIPLLVEAHRGVGQFRDQFRFKGFPPVLKKSGSPLPAR